jgi:hypothetical protein
MHDSNLIEGINVVLAGFFMVLTLLWYQEGRLADLSAMSQLTRIALGFMAALGVTTALDRYLREADIINLDIPAPLIAWAFRAAATITVLGLVISTWKARRRKPR